MVTQHISKGCTSDDARSKFLGCGAAATQEKSTRVTSRCNTPEICQDGSKMVMQHLQELNYNTSDRVGPEKHGCDVAATKVKKVGTNGATHLVTMGAEFLKMVMQHTSKRQREGHCWKIVFGEGSKLLETGLRTHH